MLSNGAWNAMLKLLEEPPKTTIFLMCTTDAQKIPKTILSRCQRFDFTKISQEGIIKRLKIIIEQENKEYITYKEQNEDALPFGYDCNEIEYEEDALNFIAKTAEGGMRDSITMLEKCLGYSKKLTVENVVKALGISDYESLDKLLFFICCGHRQKCIEIIENIYGQGKDLKLFIKQFIQFILDTCKYLLYESYDYIQIPNTIDLSWFKGTNIDANYELLLNILDKIIELSNQIKYEQNPKVLIESKILLLCKGE